MSASDAIHAVLIVGFGAAAAVLPGYLLRFRRSVAVYALCGTLWFVFAAGILAIGRELVDDDPLDGVDMLRVGAIACLVVFLLAYDASGRHDG